MFDFIKNNVMVPVLVLGLIFPPQVFAQDTPAEPPAEETEQTEARSNSLNLTMPEFSYSVLRSGERLTATSDVYLLAPDTFARIVTEYEFMQRRYELYLTERLQLSSTSYQFRIDTLNMQNEFLESELTRTNNLMLELQRNRQQDLTPLWVALSFAAGCALTVGLVYALQPGLE